MKWFYDLKISQKLILSFIIVSLITMAIGFMGIKNMGTINSLSDQMYEKELLGVTYIKEANIALIKRGRAEKNFLLSATVEERNQHSASMKRYGAQFMEYLEKARPLFYTEAGKALLTKVSQTWGEFGKVEERILALGMAENLQTEREAVVLANGEGRALANAMDDAMHELSAMKGENAKHEIEQAHAIYFEARNYMIALVVGGVLLGSLPPRALIRSASSRAQ